MKKLTYNFIKEQFEKEGYILLSTEYINSSSKLYYLCPNGHRYSISWDKWNSGRRCNVCSIQKRVQKRRLRIEFIRSAFKNENYKLLTKKYINSKQKLDYICPNGHKHSIRWDDWKSGKRCGKCKNNIKLTFDYVEKEFNKYNYKLLSNKYINARNKLQIMCLNNHVFWMSFDNFKNKMQRCPICDDINKSGKLHWNWKGGISCEPYCDAWLDKDFKESIKERDNYVCQNPDCWRKDGYASELTIHHIDYNKKNCNPQNLITLCRSCNSRANIDREWHMEWYQIIMSKRYKYNCK